MRLRWNLGEFGVNDGEVGVNWGWGTYQLVPFISKSNKCGWLISVLCSSGGFFSKFFANFSNWYIESIHIFVFFRFNLLFSLFLLLWAQNKPFCSLYKPFRLVFLGFDTLVFVCFFVFMKKIMEEVLLIYGIHPSWPDLTSENEADFGWFGGASEITSLWMHNFIHFLLETTF